MYKLMESVCNSQLRTICVNAVVSSADVPLCLWVRGVKLPQQGDTAPGSPEVQLTLVYLKKKKKKDSLFNLY